MANVIKLTGGVRDINLEYNAASQDQFKIMMGGRIQQEETVVLLHYPDDGPPLPTRGVDQNRAAFLTMVVLPGAAGVAWDNTTDALAELKRLVDGEDQQALRAATLGDVPDVYLSVQLDGASRATPHRVLWGFVDDSGSYYTPAGHRNKLALGVVIYLHLVPAGEGATISIENYLEGSPGFTEDSNADGLADGWTSNAGSPTFSIDTSAWLIGGSSQKVVTNAAGAEGVRSSDVSAAISTNVVAYAWIHVESGGDFVSLYLTDGASVEIATKKVDHTDSTSQSDKSFTDSAGRTWYRLSVSGTNSSNANFRLFIIRRSPDATSATTFYVDGAYLETGTTTAPDVWCGSRYVGNRGVPATTDPQYHDRNWIDLWGIPGDTDAIVRHKIDCKTGANMRRFVGGQMRDGIHPVRDQDLWIDGGSTDLAGTADLTNVTSSNPADVNRIGGDYARLTGGASSPRSGTRWAGFTGANARKLLATARRVFAICRSSSTASTFAFSTTTPDNLQQSSPVSVSAINTWELLDLGTLNGMKVLPEVAADTTNVPIMRFEVDITLAANGATADVDAIWLPPAVDGFIVIRTQYNLADDKQIWIDGIIEEVTTESTGMVEPQVSGRLYRAPAGPTTTRMTYIVLPDSVAIDITDIMYVGFDIVPRTRHLLGTT